MSTKSYYIDINRFSAQDSESSQTNIWDYALNDTIVCPAGSEIAIHQAFINQKGITGQSIELDEDITETINFYVYLAEGEHPVPIVQNPVSTKRSMKHDYNDSEWAMLDLFNNSESGRSGLWNILPSNGTIAHLNTQNFGGCGVPLILSKPPVPSEDNSTVVLTSITPGNSIAGQMRITVAEGANNFTFNTDDFEKILETGLLRRTGWSEGGSRPPASAASSGRSFSRNILPPDRTLANQPTQLETEIHRLFVDDTITTGGFAGYQYGYGSFNAPWPAGVTGGTYTINVRNSQAFASNVINFGNLPSGFIPTVGMRVSDIKGNIPVGSVIKSLDFTTDGVKAVIMVGRTGADIVLTKIENVLSVSLTDDLAYYSEPKNLSVSLTIKKGVYGIEQLTTVINNQLNGTMKSGTKITINPSSVAVGTGTNNGTLAPNSVGFATTITPMEYRDGPDGVANKFIDPTLPSTWENPDHCFISSLDFAKNRDSRKAINLVNRVNYSEMLGMQKPLVSDTQTALGNGFVGFIMNNNVRGNNQFTSNELAFIEEGSQMDIATQSLIGSTDENAKAIADYQIGGSDAGTVGNGVFTVGAPETNIQYDTDTSSFSINNLHSSWRIPSTDVAGQDIVNKGEVGVGLKRCAIICDAPPYSRYQTVFGDNNRSSADSGANLIEAYYQGDTNIIYDVDFLDPGNQDHTKEAAMSLLGVGSILIPVQQEGNKFVSHLTEKLPEPVTGTGSSYGQSCEVIEIVPPVNPLTVDIPSGLYAFRIKFPDNWVGWNKEQATDNPQKNTFNSTFTDTRIIFKVIGQNLTDPDSSGKNQTKMISAYQRPKSRSGGAIVYNFAYDTAIKFSDRAAIKTMPNANKTVFDQFINTPYAQHAAFKEFFSSEDKAKQIWKTKTLWGRLGFTYEQFNNEEYFEDINQYCHPSGEYKLSGITTDTILDNSTLPSISTSNNPSSFTQNPTFQVGTAANTVKDTQTYTTFDFNNPRTQLQRHYAKDYKATPLAGRNISSYSGSIHSMTTMVNVVAKPTPVSAEELPTLSKFGYYLVTSDLVPTYKDIVSKGDPLGLLGVIPKTSLSSQDFIPLTDSSIVQVLNQPTIINNIRVKILNPDLSNPQLNENSSVILRIDVPIEPPVPPSKQHSVGEQQKQGKKKKKKK